MAARISIEGFDEEDAFTVPLHLAEDAEAASLIEKAHEQVHAVLQQSPFNEEISFAA